jgi:hypothetical protein
MLLTFIVLWNHLQKGDEISRSQAVVAEVYSSGDDHNRWRYDTSLGMARSLDDCGLSSHSTESRNQNLICFQDDDSSSTASANHNLKNTLHTPQRNEGSLLFNPFRRTRKQSCQGDMKQDDNDEVEHSDNDNDIAWNEFEVQCSSIADDEDDHNISLEDFDHDLVLHDTISESERRRRRTRTLHRKKDSIMKQKTPRNIHQLLSNTMPSSLFDSSSNIVRKSHSVPV